MLDLTSHKLLVHSNFLSCKCNCSMPTPSVTSKHSLRHLEFLSVLLKAVGKLFNNLRVHILLELVSMDFFVPEGGESKARRWLSLYRR